MPGTLSTRLGMALKQMDNAAAQTVLEQQGIFYRQARPDTRIAFLFPGQGSQYTGMLRQLVDDVPAVRRQQQEIDAVMTRLGFPTWAQLAWDEASPLGKDVWTTQISMLLADVLVLAALRDRGIEPDLVAGHSYGEYPALFAAGAWDLEQAIRVTRHRCESIQACPGGQGGMLATTATPETIEALAARVNGPVYVANHNAPDQTVVGGALSALAELEKMLQAGLYETRVLAVPSPFHTPLMREAGERFRQHIAGENVCHAADYYLQRGQQRSRAAARRNRREPGGASDHAGSLCRFDSQAGGSGAHRVRRSRTAASAEPLEPPHPPAA